MLKQSRKSTKKAFYLLEGVLGLFALTGILLVALPQLTSIQKNLDQHRKEVTCRKILQEVNEKYLNGEKIKQGKRDGYPFYVTYKKGGMLVLWQDITASFEEIT